MKKREVALAASTLILVVVALLLRREARVVEPQPVAKREPLTDVVAPVYSPPPGLPSDSPVLPFVPRDDGERKRHTIPPDLPDPSHPPQWTAQYAGPEPIQIPDPSVPPAIIVDIERGTARQLPERASLAPDPSQEASTP